MTPAAHRDESRARLGLLIELYAAIGRLDESIEYHGLACVLLYQTSLELIRPPDRVAPYLESNWRFIGKFVNGLPEDVPGDIVSKIRDLYRQATPLMEPWFDGSVPAE
jgi:hypothetical protein